MTNRDFGEQVKEHYDSNFINHLRLCPDFMLIIIIAILTLRILELFYPVMPHAKKLIRESIEILRRNDKVCNDNVPYSTLKIWLNTWRNI